VFFKLDFLIWPGKISGLIFCTTALRTKGSPSASSNAIVPVTLCGPSLETSILGTRVG
jgi:hypothetical protein